MIRFALIVASTLGFFLTAAMGNLMVPLLRSLQNRNHPAQTQQAPEPDRPENADPELERPAQPPTMGGLCLMVGDREPADHPAAHRPVRGAALRRRGAGR